MIQHLLEIRRRLIHILYCFSALFLLSYYFAPQLFHLIFYPLLTTLSPKQHLIATKVTTPWIIQLQISFNCALFAVAPYALWHIWRFITPALYATERSNLRLLLLISSALFALGSIFCFYIVMPLMFKSGANSLPLEVSFLPDITTSLGFITNLTLVFGICFQVPLIAPMLVRYKLLNITQIANSRPYFIVTAFTVGMLLTPPDVLSQLLLALPLCALYEVGLLFAKKFTPAAR